MPREKTEVIENLTTDDKEEMARLCSEWMQSSDPKLQHQGLLFATLLLESDWQINQRHLYKQELTTIRIKLEILSKRII